MVNEILYDEINEGASHHSDFSTSLANWDMYLVISDNTFGEYLFSVLKSLQPENPYIYYVLEDKVTYFEKQWKFIKPSLDNICFDNTELSWIADKVNIYFCVNCRKEIYQLQEEQDKLFFQLEKWLDIVCKRKNSQFVCLPIIPIPESLPNGIIALAERELYCYYIRQQSTSSENIYLELERRCRNAVKQNNANVIFLQFDNIFGPAIDCSDFFSFEQFINESRMKGTIEVGSEDEEDYFSCIYMRDAVHAVLTITFLGEKGNVYNATNYRLNRRQLKIAFQEEFRTLFQLSVFSPGNISLKFHCLDSLKISRIGWMPQVNLKEAIYRCGVYYLEIPYDTSSRLSVYNGRLKLIKEQELNMLKIVDQICSENKIQYFLAGGSLLGAIREHDIISWDDDVDIGMLRNDYEKFRQLCPELIPDTLTYEAPGNTNNCHYTFDKIRMKDTYFSTFYSGNFKIQDGIFLDIIVYDQTSNVRWLSELHIKLISFLTRVIGAKWYGKPRRNSFYWLTKIGLPIVQKIPFSFFHQIFEILLRWYERKKDAQYLIDGIGQNIHKGRFPKEWLSDVEYVDFNDMKAPVPKEYNNYLTHFYGPHFMESPPISQRKSGHFISRIDLGDYLFEAVPPKISRSIDIRGELYES